MNYAGIDYHKRYSIVNIIDEKKRIVVKDARVSPNTVEGFRRVFSLVEGPLRVTFECGLNWGYLYDVLKDTGKVNEIIPANPLHVKIIAAAEIKTDKIDSRKLACLLHSDLIPAVYVPDSKTRARKEVIRQRAYLVKMRTRIRNRVHRIIERQRNIEMPQVSDMFGKRGKSVLKKAKLPQPDLHLLNQDIRILEGLDKLISENNKLMKEFGETDYAMQLLQTIPGIGPVISSVISTEIDKIERFSEPSRLCAYAGVVPSTYSSGGRTRHGRMLIKCNHWLKWALIEASWVSIGCDSYFGGLYRRQCSRGKKSNTAITIVARRMCIIIWKMLTQRRAYRHEIYNCTKLPTASMSA